MDDQVRLEIADFQHKVATWFLDNIPGGVSMVSAPADAFGEPVAGRRPGEHSDGLSLTSCSSCSCSRCGSDSDESSSSESAADRAQAAHPPSALGAAIAAASKPVAAHPRTDAATSLRYGAPGRPIATHSASLAAVQMGLTLPQPLGLAAIGADTGGRATDAVAMSCPGRASGRVGLDARSAAAPVPSSDSEQASGDGERRARAQKFLILSKPGGRFVPIDMSRGVILPTVVPPELPPEVLAGGNTAQLMNVDASGSQHSLQLTASTALPHYSATDLGADSYVCQSPSWQSGSVPWAHAGPGMSFSSAGAFAASPAQLADHPSHVAMGAPLVSQFPIGDVPPGARGSPAPSLAGEAAAAHADADLRRLPAGTSYGSVVRPGSISGAASLASNLRAQRGLHRISYDVLRSQGPATHVGLSPLNRSSMASGAVTPGAGGYLFGASQLNRRQLGYAGLRGYIGGNSQQHAGGRLAGGLRGDDGRLLPGHHSPLGTGTLSGRGYSFVLSQGLGTGTMPREPTSGYFSPVLPGTLTAADEHHTRHWLDSIRRSPHQQWHGPAAPASASPQPGLQHQRPSPSSLAWSNLKDGGDQQQQQQQQQQQHRPNSATPACMATGEHQQGTHLPELLGREPGAGGGYEDGPAVASAERLFWSQGEVQSVQSHSSLGAGASMGHVPVVAKEEEIEEAPQPVELEVATYMVGGVSPGLRRAGDAPADDGDEDEEEASELVSLVTMDGTVSCYDPQRKVNHFVNLNAKDPVLGIWKAKMHREVSRLSPLAEALRDGHIAADCCFGRRLAAHTPATPTRRRVGLSHGSLHDAVRYAIYVEDSVQLLNGLDSGLRRRGLRPAAAIRRLRQTSSGMLGDRGAPDAPRRERVSPRGSRGNTLARHARAGLNSRLLETISWSGRGYHTVRGAARDPPARAPAEDEGSYPVPSDSDAANASFVSSAAAAAAAAGARKPSAGRLAAGEAAASEGARAKGGIANSDGAAAAASGNGSTGTSNAGTGASLRQADAAQLQRALSKDIIAALLGWYGRSDCSPRPSPHASDHLIVSTWRGTTYFIDVGTLMDVAHYHHQFTERWNISAAAAAAESMAASSERDGSSLVDPQHVALPQVYSHASEFPDIAGLISRLRVNASVIQFKFQDTVSAFLAGTYAPATGGPNVPCMFYVDYKNRIWAYYHLDGIAEMDDAYGATWLDGEQERLRASGQRAAREPDPEAPFTVVDLAYRRMNMDPWTPLPDDRLFRTLVASTPTNYPYSAKLWRRPSVSGRACGSAGEGAAGRPGTAPAAAAAGEGGSVPQGRQVSTRDTEMSGTASDNSTPAHLQKVNANVTGSYHPSFLPGPYLCPVWADINSVDLYDLGTCNLLELAMPELLAAKHLFCAALDINPDSIDERTNLATVPGLANWVHRCLCSA